MLISYYDDLQYYKIYFIYLYNLYVLLLKTNVL